MVLLSDHGRTVGEIAPASGYGAATVRTRLRRFEAEGAEGLKDRRRSGRPPKADADVRGAIVRSAEAPQGGSGRASGYPTTATIAAALRAEGGPDLSRATVRRVLLSAGYRWRRPRHSLPANPRAEEETRVLRERLADAEGKAAVLLLDECDVHLLPPLRASWTKRGRQARVPTPGINRKRSVFGALEPSTGRWHYRVAEKKRAVDFVAFLENLVGAYRGAPLRLVLDNASIHRVKVVFLWLADHREVELVWLPGYAGHRLNPVEKVWWRMKDRVAANRLHGDIEALVSAVHEYFAAFTPHTARLLASNRDE